MRLRDVMKRFPATVNADDDLILARDYMVWRGTRHLPVLDRGKLVGLLSEADLVAFQTRLGQGLGDELGHPVAHAMQSPVQTATPDEPLDEAAGRMATSRIDCLPVTERGKLVGIVTLTDVLTAQVRGAMSSAPRNGPIVAEAMTEEPQSVFPDDHLLDAAARMQRYGIRHLPVINGDGMVMGMLSDRDVRNAVGDPRRVLGGGLDDSIQLSETRVRDVMSTPVISVRTDETCVNVAHYFADLAAGAVPVVDQDDRLIGIVSYIDILRVLADAV